MNKEDKKIQEDLVNEMMKVSKTNPDVMIYMQSLMKCYEDLEKENQQLKKQKEDVVKFVIRLYQKEYNKTSDWWLQEELCNNFDDMNIFTDFELEKMLGDSDE